MSSKTHKFIWVPWHSLIFNLLIVSQNTKIIIKLKLSDTWIIKDKVKIFNSLRKNQVPNR